MSTHGNRWLVIESGSANNLLSSLVEGCSGRVLYCALQPTLSFHAHPRLIWCGLTDDAQIADLSSCIQMYNPQLLIIDDVRLLCADQQQLRDELKQLSSDKTFIAAVFSKQSNESSEGDEMSSPDLESGEEHVLTV